MKDHEEAKGLGHGYPSKSVTRTVRFNVGGRRYDISRSLLERFPDTMLARMASDTWASPNVDSDTSLFIERDGDRFRYILDYMRDGKASLPAEGVSKDALMNDFEYFNFASVPAESIHVAYLAVESAEYLLALDRQYWQWRDEHQERMKALDQQKKALEHHGASMELACELFRRFKQDGLLGRDIYRAQGEKCFEWAHSICYGDQKLVNQYLGKFGLALDDVRSGNNRGMEKIRITLAKL